jgi:hypothetical protein
MGKHYYNREDDALNKVILGVVIVVIGSIVYGLRFLYLEFLK